MGCEGCKYYGGLVEDDTTVSGRRSICNAPPDHLKENQWKRAEGAVLPGQHCHNKEDA